MVSIALHLYKNGEYMGIKPANQWSWKQREFCLKAARMALLNVGRPETDIIQNDGEFAMSIRRLCTDNERAMVPEKYIEIIV